MRRLFVCHWLYGTFVGQHPDLNPNVVDQGERVAFLRGLRSSPPAGWMSTVSLEGAGEVDWKALDDSWLDPAQDDVLVSPEPWYDVHFEQCEQRYPGARYVLGKINAYRAAAIGWRERTPADQTLDWWLAYQTRVRAVGQRDGVLVVSYRDCVEVPGEVEGALDEFLADWLPDLVLDLNYSYSQPYFWSWPSDLDRTREQVDAWLGEHPDVVEDGWYDTGWE